MNSQDNIFLEFEGDNQDDYVRWGIVLITISETTGSFFNQLEIYL
jgi:hypothetical protein